MSGSERDARFQDLFDRYYRSVIAYLVGCGFPRDRARELAQEVFLRVYRSMDQYRGEAEWAFLQTTARNLAFNEIRGRRTQKRDGVEVSFEELSHLPGSLARDPWTGQAPASPEATLLEREEAASRRKQLSEAISKLPDGIRECLLLRLSGLKYRQIQRRMNISLDTVKSRLHEARNRLRARLAEEPEGIAWPAAAGEDDHDQED
jgi:RNA polymerase sigma-70 factor, ECF subfamily